MAKYIYVTGGVCSSLGKGIAAASIGNLLENRGLNIRIVKIDPYINVDAGTMNPYQHGEVYVTDDGAETDLDLVSYARFTSSPLGKENSITTGQIYEEVIRKEREGKFLGRCVQVIPHVTDAIKQKIFDVGEQKSVDVTIVEIGGTVGDIESIPFLEAARQFIHDLGKRRVLFIHMTLVPSVSGGEYKSKPTQHSVKALLEIGIQPDILLCRCAETLSDSMRNKISLFTNVESRAVISADDVKSTIYEIPLSFSRQGLDDIVLEKLDINQKRGDLSRWERMVDRYLNATEKVRIGIVGKYLDLHDSYKSIFEALIHGGFANDCIVELDKIDSEKMDDAEDLSAHLNAVDGILIPGGFGQRGIKGMIRSAAYSRKNNIPCFGICLGMQVMVIEYARNVLNLEDANSTEFNPDSRNPVVSLLEEQVDVALLGGTMRLGQSETRLNGGSKILSIYGTKIIKERHRHRYEISNSFRETLREGGLLIGAVTRDGNLVESVEWPNHPWGIGVQYHPEFTSKPDEAHPLFRSFVKACLDHGNKAHKN
jgi:CTP synthase